MYICIYICISPQTNYQPPGIMLVVIISHVQYITYPRSQSNKDQPNILHLLYSPN